LDEGIYGALAARVRDRRAKLAMSQQQVAAVSGLTRSSVASIETGRQSVALHHVYALARALDVSPLDLLPPVAAPVGSVGSGRPRSVELFVASLAAGGSSQRRKGT
jgi:transcriptional regulator with XRE-family HTH domain